MQKLSDRERRTVRIALGVLAVYLVFFYGVEGWGRLVAWEQSYQTLRDEATALQAKVLTARDRQARRRKYREVFGMDPASLDDTTLVSEAGTAVSEAAKTHGVGLGPSKETSSSVASGQLAVVQTEGQGTVSAVARFLHALPRLGFPVTVDRVTFNADPKQPGQLKFTMSFVVHSVGKWRQNVEVQDA